MTTLPPRQPGWFVFRGIRRSKRPGTITSFYEPVKIVEVVFPRQELGVCHVGNDTLYPLRAYEGEWEPIVLEGIAA